MDTNAKRQVTRRQLAELFIEAITEQQQQQAVSAGGGAEASSVVFIGLAPGAAGSIMLSTLEHATRHASVTMMPLYIYLP